MTPEQERLVTDNLALVPWALSRFHPPPGMDHDDLMAIGNVGLVCAAQNYDPERGFTFGTYAVHCIRNALRKEFTPVYRQKRGGWVDGEGMPRPCSPPTSLDAPLHSSDDSDLLTLGDTLAGRDDRQGFEDEDYIDSILARAADLDPRLPEIIRRRMAGEAFREIGEAMGLTGTWVAQKLAAARSLV